MKKTLEANDNSAQGQAARKPNARTQGAALQMNDNSEEGKKLAEPSVAPRDESKTTSENVQGMGLQVNDNSAGE